MSRISETPDNVLETYDWQDVAEDLQEKLDIALADKYVLEHDNKQLEDLLNKANDEVVSYSNCCIDLQQKIDKAIRVLNSAKNHYENDKTNWALERAIRILGDKENE